MNTLLLVPVAQWRWVMKITKEYRNRVLATALEKFYKNAFSFAEVVSIQARTLAEGNPSTKVLIKCGFSKN